MAPSCGFLGYRGLPLLLSLALTVYARAMPLDNPEGPEAGVHPEIVVEMPSSQGRSTAALEATAFTSGTSVDLSQPSPASSTPSSAESPASTASPQAWKAGGAAPITATASPEAEEATTAEAAASTSPQAEEATTLSVPRGATDPPRAAEEASTANATASTETLEEVVVTTILPTEEVVKVTGTIEASVTVAAGEDVTVVSVTEPRAPTEVTGAALDEVTNVVVDAVTSATPVETTAINSNVVTEVVDGVDEIAATEVPAESITTRVVSVDGPLEGVTNEDKDFTSQDDVGRGRAFGDVSVPSSEAPVEREVPVTSESPFTREVPVASKEPVTSEKPFTREVPVTSEAPVSKEAQPISSSAGSPETEGSVTQSDSVTESSAGEVTTLTKDQTEVPVDKDAVPRMTTVAVELLVSSSARQDAQEETAVPESRPTQGLPSSDSNLLEVAEVTSVDPSYPTTMSEPPSTTIKTPAAREALPDAEPTLHQESFSSAAVYEAPSPSSVREEHHADEVTVSSTESTPIIGVTRGGAAKSINEANEVSEAPVEPPVEARAVVSNATHEAAIEVKSPPSTGRSISDSVVANPDCPQGPKEVIEADARFVVILVLLCALSVLALSIIVLVMKFRVKPAARRSITMSMCWRLRRSRARRATITPPFAHHHHHHASEVERGKGKEDYNLASDEDCRADEAAQDMQDMPTWTFCEKTSPAGPQQCLQEHQEDDVEKKRDEDDDEVLCSKM